MSQNLSSAAVVIGALRVNFLKNGQTTKKQNYTACKGLESFVEDFLFMKKLKNILLDLTWVFSQSVLVLDDCGQKLVETERKES